MNFNNRSWRKFLFTGVFVLSSGMGAQSLNAVNSEEVATELLAMQEFSGKLKWETKSEGTFCEKFKRLIVPWGGSLKDIILDIDDQDRVVMDLYLGDFWADLYAARRGGILCSTTHAYADLELESLRAKVMFEPVLDEEKGEQLAISLEKAEIHGFHLDNVFVRNLYGLSFSGDLVSSYEKKFAETVNWVVHEALNSKLKSYINEKLTDVVVKMIRNRGEALDKKIQIID